MPPETPIACTLNPGERHARIASARELGERALVGLEVKERRALLHFRGESEGVDSLVAAESACCAFFDFAMNRDGEDTELEIRTPRAASRSCAGSSPGSSPAGKAGWP